jgi:cbb3-type cytochrome oxidase subunit 1
MPPITRIYVKTALAYFVLALLASMLITIRPLAAAVPFVGALSPVYFHLFMVGWVTQLIAGVAYWMFPKFTKQQPRGYDSLAWATYWLLNAGLLLRVVSEPMQAIDPQPWWGWTLVFAAVLQWLGGMAFVANTWPRVKEK